jgi:hypothetical protein
MVHLRVAVVAALADVDVPARELQRRVRLEVLHRLGRAVLEEQRDDLGQAAEGDRDQDQHDHQEVAGLNLLVTSRICVCHVGIPQSSQA